MSVEAMNYVNRVKVGDSTAKFVLTRLADRADERHSCFPAVGLIAAEIEKSDRTVQRALTLLRDLRLVSDRETFRVDGSQTTSRYVLHGPWDSYGGTGVPFPEIATPKQARAELWAQAPAEGQFREGTAAAVALSGDQEETEAAAERAAEAAVRVAATQEARKARGRAAAAAKHVGAGEEGVTPTSPHPVTPMSSPPVTLTSPLEPTGVTHSTNRTDAPSARSAGDARRATAGSRRASIGGSAASGKTSSASGKAGGNGQAVRLTPEQATAVRTVETALPAALAALLPAHRPPVVRDAILTALDSRTPEQLASRVRRRWIDHGYADALHSADGRGLGSPVGVVIGLVRPSTDCPDPMCEDGVTVDTGGPCRACAERRADRSAARQGGPVPAQRERPAAAAWWECVDCRNPQRSDQPADGVCGPCHAEAADAIAAVAALWRDASHGHPAGTL